MSTLYQQLCDILADEVERQETILAVCRAQQEALRGHDAIKVQETAYSLETLHNEYRRAEQHRQAIVAQLAQVLQPGQPFTTLSEIIASAPQPWKGRLQFYQKQLRSILIESRAIMRENELRLRTSLRIVDRTLMMLKPKEPEGKRYTQEAVWAIPRSLEPAFLDARG